MSSLALGQALEQAFRGTSLRHTVCLANPTVHSKPIAVLHDRMAHEAELGFATVRLAIELGLRVGRALVGIVLALLAVEVGAIAVLVVLRLEALVRSPGFDERAIDREVFVRKQRPHLLVLQELGHELLEYRALLKPVAVLREHGDVPDRIVRFKPHEPAIEKVVVQLLHQPALGTDAIEHLKQKCAYQLLWRDRGAAFVRVELA